MRRWQAAWLVRVRRAVPGAWPQTDVRKHLVTSPAELRALLAACRADPAVLAFPYQQRRELIGNEPSICQRGHAYDRPGEPYAAFDRGWIDCCCGGHAVYLCKVYYGGQRCGDRQIDLPLAYDCDASFTP
jgi:hypothetical protein